MTVRVALKRIWYNLEMNVCKNIEKAASDYKARILTQAALLDQLNFCSFVVFAPPSFIPTVFDRIYILRWI